MVMVIHKVGSILSHLDKRTKGENKVYKKIVILLLLVGVSFAQEKIGVVFTERIRLVFEGYSEAGKQLQLEGQIIQKEYQTMVTEYDSMMKDYEQQSLIWSPELKKAKEQDLIDTENSIRGYQQAKFGPDGTLTKRQQQLEFELGNQVKAAVDKVAISKGYDLIIDASMAVLYSNPTLNLTDDILHELRNPPTAIKE